jgi:hypothetical protein
VVGAIFAKLFGEEPSQQIADDLRRFKALLEAGEVPTIEGQPTVVKKVAKREHKQRDEQVRHASEQSFPASDPPAWNQGAEV